MLSLPKIRSLAGVVFFGLLLTGCASSGVVRLLYSPLAPVELPLPTAPRVVIVLFADSRGKEEIGVSRKDLPLMPGSAVTEWISRALADEIARQGAQFSFAPSSQIAQAARPDFLVTGVVEEVWLKETNIASYAAALRLHVRMADLRGAIYEQTISTSREKTGVPGMNLAEATLTEALREALTIASTGIAAAMR